MTGRKDSRVLFYSENGQYAVKSGYEEAKRMVRMSSVSKQVNGASPSRQERKVWEMVWSLNIKQKLKHFLWKCLHQVLPVKGVVFQRT